MPKAPGRLAAVLLLMTLASPQALANEQALTSDPAASQNKALEGMRPLDIRREIRQHFSTLPYGWWISDPMKFLNGFEVNLNIPEWWTGNPASAAGNLCPNQRSRIWEEAVSLTIKPFHKKRSWPLVECRK